MRMKRELVIGKIYEWYEKMRMDFKETKGIRGNSEEMEKEGKKVSELEKEVLIMKKK